MTPMYETGLTDWRGDAIRKLGVRNRAMGPFNDSNRSALTGVKIESAEVFLALAHFLHLLPECRERNMESISVDLCENNMKSYACIPPFPRSTPW